MNQKQLQSKSELRQHFEDQLAFLEQSSTSFDWAAPDFIDTALGHICGLLGLTHCHIVDSKPIVAAIFACQSSLPKGCCRFMQVRTVTSS